MQINGARISGRLDPDAVINAICAACKDPQTGISRAPACEQILTEVHLAESPWSPYVGVQWSSILIVLFFFVVIASFLFYIYHKRAEAKLNSTVREEVMLEVRGQLQQYYNLEDEDHSHFDRSSQRPLV